MSRVRVEIEPGKVRGKEEQDKQFYVESVLKEEPVEGTLWDRGTRLDAES